MFAAVIVTTSLQPDSYAARDARLLEDLQQDPAARLLPQSGLLVAQTVDLACQDSDSRGRVIRLFRAPGHTRPVLSDMIGELKMNGWQPTSIRFYPATDFAAEAHFAKRIDGVIMEARLLSFLDNDPHSPKIRPPSEGNFEVDLYSPSSKACPQF